MKKIAILLILVPALLYSNTSGSFLELPISAKQAALGGAFVAVDKEIDAVSYNPAGLTGIRYFGFSGMYNRQLFDNTFGKATLVHPLGFGNIGLSYAFLTIPFEMTFSSGERLDSKNLTDYYMNVAYQFDIFSNLSFGLGVRYISIDLSEVKGTSVAGDIGLLYKIKGFLGRRINLGIGVRNMGMDVEFDQAKEPLPLTICGGFMYQPIKLLSIYAE